MIQNNTPFFMNATLFSQVLSETKLEFCTNYFKTPYVLTVFDFCGGFYDDVEILKSLKIKHELSNEVCTIHIKAKTKDAVLVFYFLAAKFFLERGETWANNLKYNFCIYINDNLLESHGLTMLQFLKLIDTQDVYHDVNMECRLMVCLTDSNHFNELKATTLYLVENGYDWFLDELRRHELIKQGIIPHTIY